MSTTNVSLIPTNIPPVVPPGKTVVTGLEVAANTIKNTHIGPTNAAMGNAIAKDKLPDALTVAGGIGGILDVAG
ncbi:MAG: hypothetical protein PHU42_00060 [Patescibacteria group bacterium]|nr:hypothetical protein [Patescibacteria group bacterium]